MASSPPPQTLEGSGPTVPPRSCDDTRAESRGEVPAIDSGQPVRLRRILVRRDFLRVAARQTKAVTPGLILQAAPSPPPAEPRQRRGGIAGSKASPEARPEAGLAPEESREARVGFTVSRKVGNAVARNRARRRLRAAVEAVFPDAVQPGLDYVVIGRAATVERPFTDLLNDLRSAVKRVTSAVRTGKTGRDTNQGSTRTGQGSTRTGQRSTKPGNRAQHAPPSPKAETPER